VTSCQVTDGCDFAKQLLIQIARGSVTYFTAVHRHPI